LLTPSLKRCNHSDGLAQAAQKSAVQIGTELCMLGKKPVNLGKKLKFLLDEAILVGPVQKYVCQLVSCQQ
jgi:hypothetical protein